MTMSQMEKKQYYNYQLIIEKQINKVQHHSNLYSQHK